MPLTQNEPGFLLMYASRAAASSASETGKMRPMSVKRASDISCKRHQQKAGHFELQ